MFSHDQVKCVFDRSVGSVIACRGWFGLVPLNRFGGVNVDPLLNIPDPTNAKRVRCVRDCLCIVFVHSLHCIAAPHHGLCFVLFHHRTNSKDSIPEGRACCQCESECVCVLSLIHI